MKAKAGYFVFEKFEGVKIEGHPYPYHYTTNLGTRSELKEHLNARLKKGLEAKDFFIIRGREEKITAVKIVAEFETVES